MILPSKRDDIVFVDGEPQRIGGWWYSPTAYIVKWTLLMSLFVIFFLWVTLGYYHARKRLRQGMAPMRYHKWLVPRSQRGVNRQNNVSYYQPTAFDLSAGQRPQHVEPPPLYNPADLPPAYQPPPNGGSKAFPDQTSQPVFRADGGQTQAPVPAPQPLLQAQQTGVLGGSRERGDV